MAGCLALMLIAVLLLAMWIDGRWGEPPNSVHPVVWIGRYLERCGGLTVRCSPAFAFLLGAFAWWLGTVVVGAMAWGLQSLAFQQMVGVSAMLGSKSRLTHALMAVPLIILMGWLLKSMLSWRMLRDEVGAVESALDQSLQAGRERLSWLVSRDTSQLSESEVRESAIESLAENLNDSVVAPIFWFVLFGLPGAAVYRFANTADAMWGYRGVHRGQYWEWAGKWAAWADDVLSWVPARLTALMLMLVVPGEHKLPLKALCSEARKTPSPNSGWPMATMALMLGVRLGKPGVYTLNPAGRRPQASDTFLAQKYAFKTLVVLVIAALLSIVLVALEVAL
ncbi:MAG: cobalamin biosynthesis protein CobD [Polaromonas sp.]|uniref:adenosylcobinamide-phosphate synthase CbiB n=1 Tax=Polaromonas sp. TaxID=1869339 RepID=UPI0018061115|nr:adenosylcobinamide-phosphate synthase CbiB [Polaromonas sp.]NMM08687.1 cobalamin biosynthesis protein CobD [Polaromonas sp.]